MANFAGARIRTNNVFGTLTDNPLLIGATTMNGAGLANLEAVTSNHAVIVLDPLRVAGAPEIVIVTAHTAAATSATITRAAYGTTARQHAQGVLWIHAPTVDDVIRICTSGTRPTDVYRGQLIFETDTNAFVARDTADAWQRVVGLGAFTNWTPTITQSVNVTYTDTQSTYTKIGRLVICQGDLAITSAGTANNAITIGGLPFTIVGSGAAAMGSFRYFDNGVGNYSGTVQGNSATSVQFYLGGTQAAAMGIAPNFAMANGDVFRFMFQYEATA